VGRVPGRHRGPRVRAALFASQPGQARSS
jgi:hypothetical protein